MGLITEITTTFYLSKQDLHQEYSLFSLVGTCVVERNSAEEGTQLELFAGVRSRSHGDWEARFMFVSCYIFRWCSSVLL